MTISDYPKWLIVYIYVYGVLNILIAIPWLFTVSMGLIILLPLLMLLSGISILFKKRWSIIPISIFLLLMSVFFVLIVLPFGFGEGAYGKSAIFTLILIVQWFTLVVFWKHFVRRRHIAT